MRADMAKVLVERPRVQPCGGFPGPDKGYRRKVRDGIRAGDGGPVREGIKAPHRQNHKYFNENLAPLRRFIDSQVGRPWDKVYSEICQHVDRGNVVQKHILTHLFEYVVTDAVLIDGLPCYGTDRRYGQPLADSYAIHLWYVCPRSGLLRRARLPGRRAVQDRWRARFSPPPPPAVVRVNASLQCHRFAHGWELVTVAPLPVGPYPLDARKRDVVLDKLVGTISESEARRVYGAAVYAVARRRLRKKELRQYPIPIDLIR
jgi:hypothetical protein